MLNSLSLVAISGAELFVTHRIMTRLFSCTRKNGILPYSLYAFYMFASVTQILSIYLFHITMLTSIVLTFLVCIGYESGWMNRILAALIKVSTGIACEASIDLFALIISGISGTDIGPNLWFFPHITLIIALLKVIMILTLEHIVIYYRKKPQFLYPSITIIIAVLMIAILYMIVTFGQTPYLPPALVIISLLLVTIALCIGLFRDQMRVHQEHLRLEFLEQQSHDQLAHYTALYENSNEVHKIRHDLKNFIISAQALATQNNLHGLQQYLAQFQESVQPHALVDTGNPVLDAVLTEKQTAAPNIEFQMNIVQLNCRHIDPMDVAMLAASALDNAVEGCANISSPYIEISVQRQNEMISLLVKNPTTNTPEVKRGRIVTTKPNPERHGYGILGMQRIVDKYDGNLRWSVKDGEFILSIFLQDKPVIKA